MPPLPVGLISTTKTKEDLLALSLFGRGIEIRNEIQPIALQPISGLKKNSPRLLKLGELHFQGREWLNLSFKFFQTVNRTRLDFGIETKLSRLIVSLVTLTNKTSDATDLIREMFTPSFLDELKIQMVRRLADLALAVEDVKNFAPVIVQAGIQAAKTPLLALTVVVQAAKIAFDKARDLIPDIPDPRTIIFVLIGAVVLAALVFALVKF